MISKRPCIHGYLAFAVIILGVAACGNPPLPATRATEQSPVANVTPSAPLVPVTATTLLGGATAASSAQTVGTRLTQSATPPATVSTATETPALRGPLVAFLLYARSPGTNYLSLVDSATGSSRTLRFAQGNPAYLQWSRNGCQLYVTSFEKESIAVVSADLKGQILRQLWRQPKAPSGPSGPFLDQPIVSPSEQSIAYLSLAGKAYYASWEFQDLLVTQLGASQPVTLSERGGVAGFAWSPDGRYLAFSDFDSQGTRQLYRSDADGSHKIQLTHLINNAPVSGEYKGGYVSPPLWSPDGTRIAFFTALTDHAGSTTGPLWVIDPDGEVLTRGAAGLEANMAIMGWSEDGTELAFYHFVTGNYGWPERGVLYWANARDGTIADHLDQGRVPGTDVTLLAAIRGVRTWLGAAPDGHVYVYDASAKRLEARVGTGWPKRGSIVSPTDDGHGELVYDGQVVDALVSPAHFLGEDQCP